MRRAQSRGIKVAPFAPVPLTGPDGTPGVKDAVLEYVCGITSTLPDTGKPEIALAGKSNAGKSSLINRLVNRKALARTSSAPGKTQTLNYYRINGSFYYVDLPGYGYASAGLEVRAGWGKMIEDYLHQSGNLRAVFLLVDLRRDPSEDDLLMCRWIRAQGFEPIAVATKADKVSRSERRERIDAVRRGLHLSEEETVIAFSALTGEGKEEVLRKTAEVLKET